MIKPMMMLVLFWSVVAGAAAALVLFLTMAVGYHVPIRWFIVCLSPVAIAWLWILIELAWICGKERS